MTKTVEEKLADAGIEIHIDSPRRNGKTTMATQNLYRDIWEISPIEGTNIGVYWGLQDDMSPECKWVGRTWDIKTLEYCYATGSTEAELKEEIDKIIANGGPGSE